MAINFAVFTSAPIPFGGQSPVPSSPDNGLWSPMSCTLIYTATSAILIDCPASIAGTRELAKWTAATLPVGCTLKYFLATHAHGDHIFGVPVLQKQYPTLTPLATAGVKAGIELQYKPDYYNAVWKPNFPTTPEDTGLPEEQTVFTALPETNEIDLDGHQINVIDVGHGDTHAASFIHVADLDLVVAGDIVYNRDCHQYLGEATDKAKKQQWIEGLDTIGKLEPSIIVPGHTFKPLTTPDKAAAKDMLTGTKEYIRSFEIELAQATSPEDLFERMTAKYPTRWNLWILNVGCRANFANKK